MRLPRYAKDEEDYYKKRERLIRQREKAAKAQARKTAGNKSVGVIGSAVQSSAKSGGGRTSSRGSEASTASRTGLKLAKSPYDELKQSEGSAGQASSSRGSSDAAISGIRAGGRLAERESRSRASVSGLLDGHHQGLKTAGQRDEEERTYFESKINRFGENIEDKMSLSSAWSDGNRVSSTESYSDAQDILWREEQDALVYEDISSGWKPGGDIVGAGHRDYTEGVVSKWNEFTGGQYPINDLTVFDSVQVYENNKDIEPIDVILSKDFPGASVGVGLSAAATAINPVAGAILATPLSIAGSKIGEELNPSLISEGPMESMELVGRSDDQNMTLIITAKKYNEGGMDVQTTYSFDGVAEPVISYDYYPYDSFKKE